MLNLLLCEEISLSSGAITARRQRFFKKVTGIFSLFIGTLALPFAPSLAMFLVVSQLIEDPRYKLGIPWYVLLLVVGVIFVLPLGLLCIGWCLAAGRKRLVLLLRRFERPDIAHSISRRIESRLYRRFRLLTLSDPSFVQARRPWCLWLIPTITIGYPLLAMVLLFAIRFSVQWFHLSTAKSWEEAFVRSHDGQMEQAFILLLLILPTLIFFVFGAILIQVFRLVSNRNMSQVIDSEQQLKRVIHRISGLGSWFRAPLIMASRCTVIKSLDSCWQESILYLAEECDCVIVQVSEPSSNLLYEIEKIDNIAPGKLVFVGHKAELELREQLSKYERTDKDKMAMLQTLVRDRPVLAYYDPGSEAVSSALEVLLENVSADLPSKKNRGRNF